MTEPYLIHVQGHTKRHLKVRLLCGCGDIKYPDGIGMAHWGTKEFDPKYCDGGWVIPFAELERLYEAAKNARANLAKEKRAANTSTGNP